MENKVFKKETKSQNILKEYSSESSFLLGKEHSD